MRNSSAGVAPADVGDPFPEDRRIDQGVEPHRSTDRRSLERHAQDVLTRDHRDLAGGEHLDAVVGNFQKRILEVDHVALDVDRQDLAVAADHDLRPHREAGEQDARMRGELSVANNEVMPFKGF